MVVDMKVSTIIYLYLPLYVDILSFYFTFGCVLEKLWIKE